MEELRAPFPYFGGKRKAAKTVWKAFGDPANYIEPFGGSAAVLLKRPTFRGRRIETLNDADGMVANFWRAVRSDPAGVARAAAGPVTEVDLHARQAALRRRGGPEFVSWLKASPDRADSTLAGWWLYAACAAIGAPIPVGPWLTDGKTFSKTETTDGISCSIPYLAGAGQGIHAGNMTTGEDHEATILETLEQIRRRIQNIRVTAGDWKRVLTPCILQAANRDMRDTAVFLDPPYEVSGDIYLETKEGISHQVREWCLAAPPQIRIVLCGYDDEHDDLLNHGWQKVESVGGSGSGMSKRRDNGRRERLYLNPACLPLDTLRLF